MGTALASVISGALIVLTMFDETQVTKVDKLQGDIRDMRAKVEVLRAHESQGVSGAAAVSAASALLAEASADSTEQLAQLKNEAARIAGSAAQVVGPVERARREAIAQSTSALRAVVGELEQSRLRLTAVGSGTDAVQLAAVVEQIQQLTLRAKLERAKVNAADVRAHFEAKAADAPKSREHYEALARRTAAVGAALASMSTTRSLDSMDAQLAAVQARLVPLTRQQPYTLLMMRAIEIGLPLIACFFALFFVLRYGLTAARSREIKDLLARRHAEQDAGADPARGLA